MNAALFMDDPAWVEKFPERKSGGPKCGLPAHEDCTPLDPDALAAALSPDGALGRQLDGYEARPGQVEMLRAVVRSFDERVHLLAEAGTGVGKSLAYLVPAVHWAMANDTPVVVSTATRNLQSQLVAKDIPRAVATLSESDARTFRVAVLKGRANYVCLRELGDWMREGWFALDERERAEAEPLVDWLLKTHTGDFDEFGGTLLRPHLVCTGEDCAGRRCPYHARCFVQKAREKALHAHLVVANHALVLADAAGAGGLLPAYGRLVFDEAHNLEDAATDFLSFEFSRVSLARLVGKLERRVKRRRRVSDDAKGFLGAVSRQLRHGALAEAAVAEDLRGAIARARQAATRALLAADGLFDVLARLFSVVPADVSCLRFRVVEGVRQYATRGLFAAYDADSWDESALGFAALDFEDRLARLVEAVLSIVKALEATAGEGELQLFGDLIAQGEALAESVRDYLFSVKGVLAAGDADGVCWAERDGAGSVCVRSAPVSVADELRRLFWDAKDTVALCSATLRSGNDFKYVARKLGLDGVEAGRVRTLAAASPFDYLRQALVLAPAYLPDPAASGAAYVDALAPFLRDLFVRTRGRALALFTAHDMMRRTAERVRPLLAAENVDLLVQGDGPSREEMVRQLKKPGARVVLFGAQSFWEGVDVPGAALACVVIARLPFPQQGDPVTEARMERIEAEGGSSFRDYMLPEAIVRFRQGFGRLIRSKRDRGVVVVTDGRIVTKNYGGLFRRSLPASVHAANAPEDFAARLDGFEGLDAECE